MARAKKLILYHRFEFRFFSKYIHLIVSIDASVFVSKGIEMRLRAHYSTIVDNMETQLKVALRLQDDADKQWLEDVEARNKQQVQAMKAFDVFFG